MNQSNNQNLNHQLLLNTASRKNSYVIAKWFNLASCIWAGIIFFALLITTIVTAVQLKNIPGAKTINAAYVFFLIFALANAIISFIFWGHTKRLAEQVGTVDEVSHTAFGVFTFLFANWISGIFILIASSSFNRAQTLISFSSQPMADNSNSSMEE